MTSPRRTSSPRTTSSLKVNAVLYFRVIDSTAPWSRWRNYLSPPRSSRRPRCERCAARPSSTSCSRREKINAHLQSIIDQHTEPWGIKVCRCGQAHRPARGDAPGDGEAGPRPSASGAPKGDRRRGRVPGGQRLADASAIMAREPIALQLRFCRPWSKVAREQLDHHLPVADRTSCGFPRGPGHPFDVGGLPGLLTDAARGARLPAARGADRAGRPRPSVRRRVCSWSTAAARPSATRASATCLPSCAPATCSS